MKKNKNFRPAFYLSLLSTSLFTLPGFSATPMIGQYWAFAPCSAEADHKNNRFYESKGESFRKKNELYDELTYRGELASKVTREMSKVLNKDICVSVIDKKEAIKNASWWFLLPKPKALMDLKKQNFAYHSLKQISVAPNNDGTYCSSLVVHMKSPIHSLADLKNKEIIVASYHSTSTYLYPHYILKDFFIKNNIKIIPGQHHENHLERVKNFFQSPQYNQSALIVYKPEQYQEQYRTLMSFCGIPDYVLIANDKYISEQQRQKIINHLENYHEKHISWVEPNMERLNAFFKVIESESID